MSTTPTLQDLSDRQLDAFEALLDEAQKRYGAGVFDYEEVLQTIIDLPADSIATLLDRGYLAGLFGKPKTPAPTPFGRSFASVDDEDDDEVEDDDDGNEESLPRKPAPPKRSIPRFRRGRSDAPPQPPVEDKPTDDAPDPPPPAVAASHPKYEPIPSAYFARPRRGVVWPEMESNR